MPSARPLAERLRNLAPEALAFGTIGAANTLLYMAITWALLPIGAVKASVVATIVTTTLAYVANRYWTYRKHTRSALRREYTLFLLLNGIGLLIALTCLAISHYLLGFTSALADNVAANVVGLVLGTTFRFWSYRRFVFLLPPEPQVTAVAQVSEDLRPPS